MTREEAIARIKDHIIVHKMHEPRAVYISEALDMAIQALSQEPQCTEHPCLGTLCRYYKEPCSDAVSRDEAINTAIDAVDDWDGGTDMYRTEIITNAMKQLPSVTPQYTGNEFFNFDAPMVNKSMEQDAISREAVQIELKNCEVIDLHDENDNLVGYYNADTVDSIVRNSPPVTHKSGKWKIIPMSKIAYCSECDYLFKDIPASVVKQFDFCPKCGARMESEE